MTSFALIHGAGDSGWAWHLVEAELRERGHRTVAPDLTSADASCGLRAYADVVVRAAETLEDTADLVVVGHSLGGFTAPLVADRLKPARLVMLAAMIPQPGETGSDWWANTGYLEAVRVQSERDGGVTGNPDEMVSFYNGVPRALAEEAGRRARDQSMTPMEEPWPLPSWPDVDTRFLLFRDDHFFPPDFFRRLARERLGVEPGEVPGGHCGMLSEPAALADALLA